MTTTRARRIIERVVNDPLASPRIITKRVLHVYQSWITRYHAFLKRRS